MKVKKIDLNNFRAAKNLTIDLHPQMNLVVGVNGSGKSTILQAIALLLTALIRRVNNSKNNKTFLQTTDIYTYEDQANISLELIYDYDSFSWNLERTRPGGSTQYIEFQDELITLSKLLKSKYKSEDSLPLIVYYPVSRVVDKSINPMNRNRYSLEHLDVYDNALEGKPNYQNFFSWFREQDDLVNQKAMSRTHWIRRYAPHLRRRITQLFREIDRLVPSERQDRYKFQKNRSEELEFLVHEPRFLFREMSEMIRFSGIERLDSLGFREMLYELDYMLHKMDMLSSDGNDSIVDSRGNLLEILDGFLSIAFTIRIKKSYDEKVLNVIWTMFVLSFELGLWWLSDEGHSNLVRELSNVSWPTHQQTFFDVNTDEFKYRIVGTVDRIIENDIRRRATYQNNLGRDLEFVSRAIEEFIPEYSNIRIDRNERRPAQMFVDKNGQQFNIDQLSDGEKNLIALIGDITRRLTIGNPHSVNPLDESGVILIDEIDLHLHPKWQRIVAERLTKVFPNCQFILSSHSPQIISHIKPESIIVLKNDNGEVTKQFVNSSYGKSSDRILEDIMDESARPKYIDDEIKSIFRLIQSGEIKEAQKKISELKLDIGEDSDLIKAGVLIKRREIIGK